MANINFEKCRQKVALSGKIPSAYFLNLDEVTELWRIASDGDIFDALCKAFYAGFIAGNHATLKHNLKRM